MLLIVWIRSKGQSVMWLHPSASGGNQLISLEVPSAIYNCPISIEKLTKGAVDALGDVFVLNLFGKRSRHYIAR